MTGSQCPGSVDLVLGVCNTPGKRQERRSRVWREGNHDYIAPSIFIAVAFSQIVDRQIPALARLRVDRSGTYLYYFCVSSWSTMQVTGPSVVRDGLESIVIFADGEPLLLELSG